MSKTYIKSTKNYLHLTKHAKQRLSDRDLWPALPQIAAIAHDPNSPRFYDLSTDGRRVERIEIDGICIILARKNNQTGLILLTVHSGQETGSRACARISSVSRSLVSAVRR